MAPDSLTGVIITDKDVCKTFKRNCEARELSIYVQYPYRVAFSLLNKILDEYTTAVPRTTWGPAADSLRSGSLTKAPPSVDFPPLAGYLVKYQDPKQADTIMKVQQELDETKVELGRTIESILQRGEKLDSLVEKSNQLSYSSKAFYKTVSILGTLLIWATVSYAFTRRRANNRYISSEELLHCCMLMLYANRTRAVACLEVGVILELYDL